MAANESQRSEEIIMQNVTPNCTKITDTPFAKGFGEYNLWDLWLLDEAEDVPCGSIRTFLYYLCLEGTTLHRRLFKGFLREYAAEGLA